MNGDIEKARVLRAAAIVVAIVVALPLAGLTAEAFAGRNPGDGADSGGLSARSIVGGDIEGSLARLEDEASGEPAEIPDYFLDEIGFLPNCHDIRVDETGTIIGYQVDEGSEGCMRMLQEQMEGSGWSGVPLGGVEGATFVKEDGRCKWALATCTQVGDATCVVFRCAVE